MNQDILRFCLERGCLLDKEVLELLSQMEDINLAKDIINKLHQTLNERFLTRAIFTKNFQKIKGIVESYGSDEDSKKTVEKLCINLGVNIEVTKEKLEREIKNIGMDRGLRILRLNSLKEKKLLVEDFTKYFKVRFVMMKNLLQDRPELNNLVSINKLSANKLSSLIGLVANKRVTKNKNILLEIEDLTGRISVLVNQNKPEIYDKAKDILLDEVIAVKGVSSGLKEIFFVNDLLFPDARLFEKKKSLVEDSVAFTSDLHVGSGKFLEKNFLKFIRWLNGQVGDDKQRKEALKVKFLFITGDSIDGVGIFPGQEALLKIKDIKEQYHKLAELLSLIRKDINIVLCPGQHDGVRVAEPQPVIDKTFGEALYALDNLFLVTNPASIEITSGGERFEVLMYHGASIHGFIEEIDKLRFGGGHDKPAQVVKYMLQKRHLAPSHSSVVYIPSNEEDLLAIHKVPDIITTGDLHRAEVDNYNNIQIITSSCWQSITPFEEKVGNHPDPCKVPILNLKTRNVKILDFSDVGKNEK